MRSYHQYCAVAKALDVVGDRWTLLIVRELLLREECRYTDLRSGLPGIATNLLADRLRELERAGLVSRRQAPPPVATALFGLTERGRALRPVIDAIGRWGIPYMVDGPEAQDAFRGHWLAWPVEVFLADNDPAAAPVTLALESGGEQLLVTASAGEVTTRPGPAGSPDATLSGQPHAILGVLSGHLEPDDESVDYDGSPAVLARLRATASSP